MKEKIGEIIKIFKSEYPLAACTLNYSNPLELLIATTDAFNQANVNKSTEDQWKIMVPMVKVARDAGLKITGGMGGCWTCLENGIRWR